MEELPKDEKVYWLDQKKNVDLVIYILIGIGALVTLMDLFYDKHGEYGFENMVGFHSLYGFVGYVGLVLLATQLRRLTQRPKDYYND
ncbi:MAG: hypothetical protein JXX28_14835 [Deltaproteobacteria bacterium]|nr:hypothetical protein [Deltaproteobacteria bacterium]